MFPHTCAVSAGRHKLLNTSKSVTSSPGCPVTHRNRHGLCTISRSSSLPFSEPPCRTKAALASTCKVWGPKQASTKVTTGTQRLSDARFVHPLNRSSTHAGCTPATTRSTGVRPTSVVPLDPSLNWHRRPSRKADFSCASMNHGLQDAPGWRSLGLWRVMGAPSPQWDHFSPRALVSR